MVAIPPFESLTRHYFPNASQPTLASSSKFLILIYLACGKKTAWGQDILGNHNSQAFYQNNINERLQFPIIGNHGGLRGTEFTPHFRRQQGAKLLIEDIEDMFL
jgi:hypothetical protein